MNLKPIEETIAEVKKANTPTPIIFSLEVNGKKETTKTSNILSSLRQLKDKIMPTSVKTMSIFRIELEGKVYYRILKVWPMRMLLGNDQRRIMTAKVINSTLGLHGEDLYK